MNANRIHLILGFAVFGVFLCTGLYMRANFPGLYHGNEAIHYMYRANHIYILLSGLLNIIVGVYSSPSPQRWKANLQRLGSLLFLLGPAILVFAFFYEASRGGPERPVTLIGVLCLFTGTACHLPNKKR